MTFSRSHAGMVGIISLFTGMIVPIAGSGNSAYPFPLTDIQTLAYIVLFILAIGFYLVSIRRWGMFKIIGMCLISLLGYMSYIALTGQLHSIQGNTLLTDMRWGWIFVGVGCTALLYTIFAPKNEDDGSVSFFSDAIIGIVGTITIVGLSALIIGASVGGKKENTLDGVVQSIFGSGTTVSASGVTMSRIFGSVTDLSFERENDAITFLEKTESGAILHPYEIFYPGEDIRYIKSAGKDIVFSRAGIWIDRILLPKDTTLSMSGDVVFKKYATGTEITPIYGTISYTGIDIDTKNITVSEKGDVILWTNKTASGYVLLKNGKSISDIYRSISNIVISRNGHESTALAENIDGEKMVLKNGIPVEMVRDGYIEGSLKSNGSHTLYATKRDTIYSIIYDGVSIGKDFAEIREIFIEKNGNSYVFFARPINSDGYCLFTRYKGNLCGLTGYMNPRLSADENTVIYAGLHNGSWGIYRNTNVLIQDTGYSNTDISGDYVFFDITNPKQYLFIERGPDGEYKLRKNGKILPQIWKDVGLDVTFGYDDTVIMSTQDDQGWRIIEI